MYRLTQSDSTVHRLADNAFIPFDGGNRDYKDYLEWLAEGNAPEPYVAPPPPVPQSITRRQCAIELREKTMITPQEALDMTRIGTPPALVQTLFDAMQPETKILAETDFAADTYVRTNPLLVQIMLATGASEAEIDDFFRSAAER